MSPLVALFGAVVGGLTGLLVPRLISWCPEPSHDPAENPEDYPDHVPFAALAARPRVRSGSVIAGAVAGALIGLVIGWGWALAWLLVLVPVCTALSVIDYVDWYLPKRLVWSAFGVVAAVLLLTAVVLGEPAVLTRAVIGCVALGGYYGLLWLISPRVMAFGDVRLGALLGLALGPFGIGTVLLSVLVAAVLAVVGMLPMRRGGVMIRRNVPYGPFLALGALVAVVVGQVLAGL